jgi:hypothetical protein
VINLNDLMGGRISKGESDGKFGSHCGVGGIREPFQLPDPGQPVVNFVFENVL